MAYSFTDQLAVMVKSIRAAMGWSQDHFSQMTGISRPTLQRLEQKDPSALRTDSLDKIFSLLHEAGITYEIHPDRLTITFHEKALNEAVTHLHRDKRPSRKAKA